MDTPITGLLMGQLSSLYTLGISTVESQIPNLLTVSVRETLASLAVPTPKILL